MRRRTPPPPLLSSALLFALLAALAVLRCCAAHQTAALDANAADAASRDPAAAWAAWLASEKLAHSHRRAGAELRSFGDRCAFMAPAWASASDAHATLQRVLVVDARHDWNGIGDSLERYTFALRAGRALRRATFLLLDSCADASAPPRDPPPQHRRRGGCAFDPGAHVTGFGAVDWRWDGAAAARVRFAQGLPGDAQPVALRYNCEKMDYSRGCLAAFLRHADNASVAVFAEHESDPGVVAEAVWGFMRDAMDAFGWVRLETTNQGDMTHVARLPWVCAAAGHPESSEPLAPGEVERGCDLGCESFGNWRPRTRTWAAMRPALAALDGWEGAVGLVLRSGVADHVAAHPSALAAAAASAPESADAFAQRLAALFTPCANGTQAYSRELADGEAPCVNYASDRPDATPPSLDDAARCGAEGPPPAHDAPSGELLSVAPGPLGAYIACATHAAHALAGGAASASPLAATVKRRYGVMVFSDAPAFKCLLENSALARAGHAAATPSAPGHVGYAPDGPALYAVAQAAIVDHFVMGLVDALIPITRSAYGGAANLRRASEARVPRGAGMYAAAMQPGFERWFAVGRENLHNGGHVRVDAARLAALLAAPLGAGGCPVTAGSVAHAAEAYTRSAASAAAADAAQGDAEEGNTGQQQQRRE
jgi:hypothetical protein